MVALRLEDRERIRQQKARYCRLLDTKEFDAWEGIFDPVAKIVFRNIDGSVMAEFERPAEFVRLTRGLFATNKTIHQVHHSEIEFKTETEASVIWSMEDWHVEAKESEGAAKTMHGYGFYHEVWRSIDGVWKISRMELRRNIIFE